ncbi:potassium channel KOR1 isoform X2 [Phoenix dactylifera]|uniref:Potassium channel n=1 Tax=Phoenix dactylifera TaxID=42345 RepID=A0A8B7CAT0_PHODC|nr:potassium channel KOR1 isoform X2 [Phoenix dactylifera]
MSPHAKNESQEIEYELEEPMGSSRGIRWSLITSDFAIGPLRRRAHSHEKLLERFVIEPDNKWYQLWTRFILVWALYSSFFTPIEFGFFRGLPNNLFWLDFAGQVAFLVDIFVQFLVAYRDSHTYRMIYKPTSIAVRYVKSSFVFDLLGCFPWDVIYKACGNKEEVRYLLWIRLTRVRKVTDFFQKMEKDIRINYLFTRIVKLIVVELYCTHTAACIFYYLATTLPASMEGYTWMGSLKLGDYSYSHFRDIDLGKRYITSLYFAIVTMSTVGYGDIHAVNPREMVFIMIYVSFDMILGAYLIGNMTALIVKGSKTERFRDRMKDLVKYMNRNKLGKEIRDQIKSHVRLQYESSYTEASVLQDLPVSIRAKISETLYKPYIDNVPLFSGCSEEFIHQIIIKLQEEFFLPGEVLLEQGDAVDQLYFVCHGKLEGVGIGEDGSKDTVLTLQPNSSFGEIAILCNIPQPFTVRVCELCRLLRIDKQVFTNILQIYFVDGRRILNNLLEGNDSNRIKQLESDITFHITKQEAELALRVNSDAFYGDLHHLKGLIQAGADPNKTDYDGRSPLHLAAARGHEDITLFLIQEGVDINLSDNFGNTPLFEAIKDGHDRVASLLFSRGAQLSLKDAGSQLCAAAAEGDSDFIKRALSYGVDPNSKDYDHRTALHIAAAEGLYFIAKLLLDAGASVFAMDRWGATPLDEARKSGNKSLMLLLEGAKSDELSKFPERAREVQDKMHPRRCTVFPFHPWDSKEERREGVMLWIPCTMEKLIRSSREQLKSSGSRILSEDGARILDVDMISDGQKLYLVADQETSTHNNQHT